MSTILILFGISFGCFFILYLFTRSDKKKIVDYYEAYTPNGLMFVKKLEEIFENNETLPIGGELTLYQEMFGKFPFEQDSRLKNFDKSAYTDDEAAAQAIVDISMSSSYVSDMMNYFNQQVGIDNYDTEPEGSKKLRAGDYLSDLLWSLAMRYDAQYRILPETNEDEAMTKYGLNIQEDEVIYERIKQVDWYEEKSVTTSYSYGGFQYRLSMGKGLSYRMGNLKVSPNKTDQFLIVDRGYLYLTNKRLIFVGEEKHVNKTIKMDDILEFDIFNDGILIGKSNGKKPLIVFSEWVRKPRTEPVKRDHLNIVTRLLDRVLSNTQAIEIKN